MGRIVHITPQMLRDAHARLLRLHRDWTDGYDADMSDPIRSRMVRAIAVGAEISRIKSRGRHPHFVRDRHIGASRTRQSFSSRHVDGKSLAAGEKPDDEFSNFTS